MDDGTTRRLSRRDALGATAVVGASALSGCTAGLGTGLGSNGSGSNQPVKYVSGNNSPKFKSMLRGFAEQFEEERGIPVDIEFTEIGGSYDQRVAQLIQGGNPPDIINAEQFRIGAYATQGVLRPVGDVIAEIEDAMEPIPDKFKFTYEGKPRLVPAVASVTNNWYRQDVYEEMGLPEPTTWEKQRRAARTISEADNDLHGVGYATAATVYGSYHAWVKLWSNDAQVAKREDGTVKVALDEGENRKRAEEVLRHTKEMVQYSPTATNWDWGEIYESYAGGTVATALYSGGRPKTQSIGQDRPWAKSTKRASSPYNSDTRDAPLANAAGTGYGLVKNSPNPEQAKEFVKFLLTGEQLVEFARALRFHNVPVFESWYEPGSQYREGWEYLDRNFTEETIQGVRETLFSENAQPFTAETDPANPYASPAFTSYALGRMFYNVTAAGMTPETAVRKTANTLRKETEME